MSKVVDRIACPVCQSEGKDSEGDNLTRFENGAYACCANPGHTKLVVKVRPDLATQAHKLKNRTSPTKIHVLFRFDLGT